LTLATDKLFQIAFEVGVVQTIRALAQMRLDAGTIAGDRELAVEVEIQPG